MSASEQDEYSDWDGDDDIPDPVLPKEPRIEPRTQPKYVSAYEPEQKATLSDFVIGAVILFIAWQVWFWIEPTLHTYFPLPTPTRDRFQEWQDEYYSSKAATAEAERWDYSYRATRDANQNAIDDMLAKTVDALRYR